MTHSSPTRRASDRKAGIAKIDVGPRGALVSFHNDGCPNLPGLLAYVERLNGVAKLRPDSKLVINRTWKDPHARINGALQLSKGLAKARSEEHTSELQSLMRISYAVFCLKKKKRTEDIR